MNVRLFLIRHHLIEPHTLPSNNEFRIICPQCHNDKEKCYVNAEGKGVKCFHCTLSKSWTGFMRLYEPPTPQEKALEAFVSTTQKELEANSEVKDYLLNRGFTDEILNKFRIGYLPNNPQMETLPEYSELGIYPGKWHFAGYITIPYLRDGFPISIRGRVFGEENGRPKYLSSKGGEGKLFTPDILDYQKPVYVCEGEFDAIFLNQLGYQAVGVPGALVAKNFAETLQKFSKVYLCFDGDDAGRAGAKNLKKSISEVYEVLLPDGYDVSEYVSTYGEESFRQLLNNALFFVEGKEQLDDSLKSTLSEWQDWAWTNGELLGPKITWAPRLEKALSGWSKGLFLIGALPNSGKCLGKGTPVLMYNGGIKPVEEIKTGEYVMGPDSKPRLVLGTNKGTGPLHKVIPLRGMPYIVNDEHILSVKHKATFGYTPFNLSIKEYYKLPKSTKESLMGWRTGVEFDEVKVEIDPYLLGVWLGDGSNRSGEFTTIDSEIEDAIRAFADTLNMTVSSSGKTTTKARTYRIKGEGKGPGTSRYLALLDYYNLRNNKHIPSAYLANTRKIRLELLAGLIDTDGYNAGYNYEISQKSQRLAYDIQRLAQSLGFYSSVKEEYKTCQTGHGGFYYRVYISGDISEIPVRLTRKKFKYQSQSPKNTNNIHITVEPIGDGEYYGFELDGDGLFLLGDFTVTHNSCFFVKSAYEAAKDNPNDTIVSYLTLDDDQEDALCRLVSLHTNISFEEIRTPRISFDHPTDKNKRNPEKLKYIQDKLEELRQLDNLIVRDSRYGRSLQYIRKYASMLRKRHSDKRIVLFVDSLAKLTAENEPEDIPIVNWKAHLANELKYLSNLYNLCIVTPADFRKINDARRPTNDDLKDAAELAYEANCVLLGFNEANIKGLENSTLKWVDDKTGKEWPILEMNLSKNKKSMYRGEIRFKFYPPTSNFQELTANEDAELTRLVREQQQSKQFRVSKQAYDFNNPIKDWAKEVNV